MTIGIVGRKRGMTRIFTEEGHSVPVTVIEAQPNRITSLTDTEKQGYRAVQLAWGEKRKNLINKPRAGTLSKSEIETAEGLAEFRLDDGEGEDLVQGSEIKVDIFADGQIVDVTGTSIGKGFAGAIKRHNFSHQRNSHGNSISHRAPGSIGQCQTPGRVFRGKKMAGHMGNVRRTCQNLEIVRVDTERNLLLVKGAVPGAKGGKVIVQPAVKAKS
ncbi:MAG: 50S ribosomal protein L3 [Gammaproteobacteria bacterium]|nr:50S ribosomal protein L3 [Gammaproteobacteria bacterium]